MGAFSIWHWIIVLIILSVPAFVGLVIWLVVRAVARSSASASASAPASQVAPVSSRPPAEARLQELASLRSKGLLTDEEYERQRAVVIRGV